MINNISSEQQFSILYFKVSLPITCLLLFSGRIFVYHEGDLGLIPGHVCNYSHQSSGLGLAFGFWLNSLKMEVLGVSILLPRCMCQGPGNLLHIPHGQEGSAVAYYCVLLFQYFITILKAFLPSFFYAVLSFGHNRYPSCFFMPLL